MYNHYGSKYAEIWTHILTKSHPELIIILVHAKINKIMIDINNRTLQ